MLIVKKIVHWLLVPGSAVIIIAGTVFGSRWAVNIADNRCAPENMIGGACVESWHTGLVELAIYAGLVLCALGLTLIPAAIAPSFKRLVSIVGALLTIGSTITAYYFTRWPELIWPVAVATLVCTTSVLWVWSWRKPHATA